MRKAEKRQIWDFVKLLGEAHMEIRGSLEKGTIEKALALLQQCQQMTIQLGTLIENLEGKDTVTVHILEEYCEALYHLYGEIAEGRSSTAKIYKKLRSQSIRIENSVKSDIPIRREAVFLPYKASMWDSLESVWKAAREDENCDTYVIPIPYYDKNPDGSLREMHYEGKQYPSYVDVVDYESYDFAKHRPDMVFIHNPYDDCNYVTCVHPFFFSENLKKYTEQLIYIPYFASGGAGAVSYRNLPVCYYADYIVIQSEQYSRYFEKAFREKLLPLGTPKFDRILNYCLEEDMIPADWREKLTGKVFFYNTSIAGILRYGEQAVKKMIYVFENFKDAEVALIWRPHPLLEASILSMRPALYPFYELAKKKFSELPHGILDLTPDVDLAVKLSDAYIGEKTSSVVHLFGVSGKPVFLTNMNITEHFEEECRNVKIYGCTMAEGSIWAPAGDRNCLMKITKDGVIEETYEITGEKKTGQILYRDVIQTEGRLYLVPFNGEEIAVFDLKKKNFEKIPLRDSGKTKFIKGHLYKGCIYMVPFTYPCLVKLDCASHKLTYYKEMGQEMKCLQKKEGPLSLNGSLLAENELLIAMAMSSHVIALNLDTGKWKVNRIGQESDNYCCMANWNGKIILGSHEGMKLTCWDRKTGETNVITGYPMGWKGESECFYEMVCMGDSLYVFPWKGNQILKIAPDSFDITALLSDTGHDACYRKNGYYTEQCNYTMVKAGEDGEILVQSAGEYGLAIYAADKPVRRCAVHLNLDEMPYQYGTLFGRCGSNLPWAMGETKLYSIKGFIHYVCKEKHDSDTQIAKYREIANNLDGSCGSSIYQELVKRSENR